MRINRLRLVNVCQMKDQQMDLSPGLNVIVGPNGSGKSNTVKMLYAAITNDFSRNSGVKTDNISQFAGPKEPSSIQVEFEHAGADYRLERSLRPGRQSLTAPGRSPATKEADIGAAMAGILGVGPDILDEYVFVDQWRIFDFLNVSPAKRAQAFQRLFGTVQAEKIWDLAGEELNRLPSGQQKTQTDLDDCRRRRTEILDEQQRLVREISSFSWLSTSSDEADRVRLSEARRWKAASTDRQNLSSRLDSLVSQGNRSHAEKQEFEQNLQGLLAHEPEVETNAAAARSALTNWSTLKSIQATRNRIQAQLDKARAEESSMTRPVCDTDRYIADLDKSLAKRCTGLTAEIDRLNKFINSFDSKKGLAECPTCFTPVSNLSDALRAAKQDVSAYVEERNQLTLRLEYSRSVDILVTEYVRWEKDWLRRIADLESHLAGITTVPTPGNTEEELNDAIVQRQDLANAIRDVRGTIQNIDRDIARIDGEVSGLSRQLTRYDEELTRLKSATEIEIAELETRIHRRERAVYDHAQLTGRQQVLQNELARCDAAIAQYENEILAQKKLISWGLHLQEIRTVLHRDNLPRIVAHHYLEMLQGETNRILEMFDAPFRVEAADDLSFVAVHHDGRRQPASRLSGGEKVVLALGFRISVNSTFAQDVGLLCLDEPTVGLDDHNLGCLETALIRLKELSQARSLQVILVTHEKGLNHLFDHVIELAPAGTWPTFQSQTTSS